MEQDTSPVFFYGLLYIGLILIGAAILAASELLPWSIAPRLLMPYSKGNALLMKAAMFFWLSGFYGLVAFMIPPTNNISIAFAIAGGLLSFVFGKKYK